MFRRSAAVSAALCLASLSACDGAPGRDGAAGVEDAGRVDTGRDDGGSATVADGSSADAAPGVGCEVTDRTRLELESGMALVHHDGQTFVSWPDRAEGEEGAGYRYRLYRSPEPITDDADLAGAELVASGILSHSGQLFGSAFRPEDRLDPEKPMAIVEEGAPPLPPWSGLWVAETPADECAWYAVIATDLDDAPVESVAVGVNTTPEPIAERVAPRQPLKVYDSNERGIYTPQTRVTGTPALPLRVQLHASQAGGGGAGAYGDYWLYFGDESMGYQAGLPGVFSVEETHDDPQYLVMRNRDTIVRPDGSRGLETMWFGYVAAPNGVRHAYPYTEQRLLWMIPWVIERYEVDPERVYLSGGSMGAWGTMTFGFRHPELFAAVYPDRPRFRQTTLRSITSSATPDDTLPDGTTWRERGDSVLFARRHRGDLPFLGWNVGRRDGFASWQEQVDMVAALTESHHGFAFAWNDGDHTEGSTPRSNISRWYPPTRFARNLSYPAFGNSSIDDDLGSGDASDGDLEGGINLGFEWSDPVDEPDTWSCAISNALADAPMTVDVTPRRAQRFRPEPGESVAFTDSLGHTGTVVADEDGLLTVVGLTIRPGEPTVLTLTRGGGGSG